MGTNGQFWSAFAERHESEWREALSTLLRFDTVSGDNEPKAYAAWRGKIAEGFAYLKELGDKLGFATRLYEDRVLVIEAAAAGDAQVLGFPIHLDVVPAGEGWTRDPFGGQMADDAIWGRGAQDDKGPIIQTLFGLLGALEHAREVGRPLQKTVRIIVVSEEECGQWDDIPYYFERERPPDFSIVPDAEFPITNGEKGVLNLYVDFEWADPILAPFEIVAGERANVVPAKAHLKISNQILDGEAAAQLADELSKAAPSRPDIKRGADFIRMNFHGVGAHGSLPHKGYNAATDALTIAAGAVGLRRHAAGFALAWLADTAGSLDGAFVDIKHRHEKVGATTVNLGVLRVNETSCHAVLNIRNPIGLPGKEVQARIQASLEKLKLANPGLSKVSLTNERGSREPIYVDPDQFSDWIEPMKHAYKETTGRDATLQTIGGTTFAKAFPNAVCFGPVDPNEKDEVELAHQADEHVTFAAMRRNVEIYGRTIVKIAGS